MDTPIVRARLTAEEFSAALEDSPEFAKVVVDTARRVLVFGIDLHADGEQLLLDDGSRQEDLWGANIYPGKPPGGQIEYTSMINIRPRQGNRSMDITEATLRDAVASVIRSLLPLS
ncbi:MAG: hypothetical protein G01um101438_973 [Parcubacteria group bacterium Gr01-1014_38]|nr:MAG: hypothetical protein G01um101438_973 [Parcubacteria group bacterium Gr01-1014_38]